MSTKTNNVGSLSALLGAGALAAAIDERRRDSIAEAEAELEELEEAARVAQARVERQKRYLAGL